MAQMVKNMSAMEDTQVLRSQEEPLKDRMATRSSILAWRIPWTEEPGGLYSPWVLQSMGCKSRTCLSNYHFHFTWHQILSLKLYMHYLFNPHKNPLGWYLIVTYNLQMWKLGLREDKRNLIFDHIFNKWSNQDFPGGTVDKSLTRVCSLVWEDPVCHETSEFECHNYRACALESRSHIY